MNTNNGSTVVYAGLLVSFLAHFGWILSQSDAIAIIGGIIVAIGAIWQHYTVKKIAGMAKAMGVNGLK